MNWQTKELIDNAISVISDEATFSHDQILALRAVIELIGSAISRECDCNKLSINM